MKMVPAASIGTFVLLGFAFATTVTVRANDRELLIVLARAECVPAKVVRTDPSPALVLYEVTCKRSGRMLDVACLKQECRLQTRPREDDER